MIPFSIVVAMDEQQGIGLENKLPWHLPGELKYFRDLTTQTQDSQKMNVVVMGRKTWESLPEKYRPLPNRINVVLSTNTIPDLPEGCIAADSFLSLFDILRQPELKARYESVFIIGGAGIYGQALDLSNCEKLYVTHICQVFSCDAFFPAFLEHFQKTKESSRQKEGSIEYYFAEYKKKTIS